ncbi:hypothetical protein [Pseudomonas sp. NPDC007930]|uniref:hypothetical protein n=1 Tax=Pseudomonas sp. NPDC007930 TaxID=3364417 RepID=UPI0036ECB059
MIASLAQRYSVAVVKPGPWARRLYKLLRSLGKKTPLKLPYAGLGRWVARTLGAGRQDLLLCNEGELFRGFNTSIVQAFAGRKVLLVRDLIDAAALERARPMFDRIYSFDPAQCAALGIDHLEQFFPYTAGKARALGQQGSATPGAPRFFFLGREKGRSAAVHGIADALAQYPGTLDFHLVGAPVSSPYHVAAPYSYRESIRMALAADVLVEVNQAGQAGFTLRVLEALFFDKKLLTTNAQVAAADFYDPARFFIWGVDPIERLPGFISGTPPAVAPAVLERLGPEAMIKRVASALG